MIILYALGLATAYWSIFFRVPHGSASGIFLGISGLSILAGLHEQLTRQYVLDGVGLFILGTILLAVVDLFKYLAPKNKQEDEQTSSMA